MNTRRPRWFSKLSLFSINNEITTVLWECRRGLSSWRELEKPGFISGLLATLKECSQLRDLEAGKRAHAQAIDSGVISNIYVANNLINMYGKCGSMSEAQKVFDGISRRSVVSWNCIIQGYVENGESERGLNVFHEMQQCQHGCAPDARSYVAALTACTSLATNRDGDHAENGQWFEVGKLLHSQAVLNRCCNIVVENTVINLYGKCGCLVLARNVFDNMLQRSVVSWNALLQSYVENGETELALEFFNQIQGFEPDARSFAAAVTACACLGARKDEKSSKWLERGREIHSRALKNRCCNVVVETALIDMYAKCGSMVDARRVFDGMSRRDVVSWTCLIQGYVDNGESQLALDLFERMEETQASDARAFVAALSACAALAGAVKAGDRKKWLEKGKSIHSRAVKSSNSNTFVENALMNLCGRCGSLDEARALLNSMHEPSSVSLKLLLQGYLENGYDKPALELLLGCYPSTIKLDSGVLTSALTACGNLMADGSGRVFHSEILRAGHEQESAVTSSLIEFYGKCGRMSAARNVLDSAGEVDIWLWNSLLGGYSLGGHAQEFFDSMREMREQKIKPNAISFTYVLTVCSHGGLTFQGKKWFEVMENGFGVTPDVVHYTCMVDLLARGNLVDEALKMMEHMPFPPNVVTWTAILAACWNRGDVETGRRVFESLVRLDGGDASAYNLMANIYGDCC